MIEKYLNIRVMRATLDVAYNVKDKEIFIPSVDNGFQLSLKENGKHVGILKIDNDERFLEFFELIKKSKLFDDFSKPIQTP